MEPIINGREPTRILTLVALLAAGVPLFIAATPTIGGPSDARAEPAPRRAAPADDRHDDLGYEVLEGGRRSSRALVIVLHGGSWNRTEPIELARRARDALHKEARRAGLRLLVPEAPAASSTVPWITGEGEARVLGLLQLEVASRKADAARVYLAGHGAGGTAALTLTARHPTRFAAVAAWAATPSPLWDEDRRVIGLAENVVAGLQHVPTYLWTGDDDRVLDRATLRIFVEGMQRVQSTAPFEWDHGPGGHDYGPEGPRAGLRFLANQRR